jgi:hypothetical protein
MPLTKAQRSVYPRSPSLDNQARQGILLIDGVPTKHYLKEELELWLKGVGLTVEKTLKLEYPWDTEFENPPKSMQEPYPWDWLVVARRD